MKEEWSQARKYGIKGIFNALGRLWASVPIRDDHMKLRLLSVLLAATGLGGCATYDYAGGAGGGGYYHGRPSVDNYGGYGAYGGYGGYPYGYGRYGYGSRYYGGYGYYGYNPYYPYPRYVIVHPPHDDDHGDDHDHDHDRDHDEDPRDERPPPWRAPDGRYRDSGQVMIPPRNRVLQESSSPRRVLADPSRPMTAPRSMTAPRPMTAPRQMSAPRPSAPSQRAARTAPPQRSAPRPRQESMIRNEEN